MTSKKMGAPCGERHGKATLTNDQVRLMRWQREYKGRSYASLAKEHGCGESTARDIVNYITRIDA